MQNVTMSVGSPKADNKSGTEQVKHQMQMIQQMQNQLSQKFMTLQKTQWEDQMQAKSVDKQLEMLKSL